MVKSSYDEDCSGEAQTNNGGRRIPGKRKEISILHDVPRDLGDEPEKPSAGRKSVACSLRTNRGILTRTDFPPDGEMGCLRPVPQRKRRTARKFYASELHPHVRTQGRNPEELMGWRDQSKRKDRLLHGSSAGFTKEDAEE